MESNSKQKQIRNRSKTGTEANPKQKQKTAILWCACVTGAAYDVIYRFHCQCFHRGRNNNRTWLYMINVIEELGTKILPAIQGEIQGNIINT